MVKPSGRHCADASGGGKDYLVECRPPLRSTSPFLRRPRRRARAARASGGGEGAPCRAPSLTTKNIIYRERERYNMYIYIYIYMYWCKFKLINVREIYEHIKQRNKSMEKSERDKRREFLRDLGRAAAASSAARSRLPAGRRRVRRRRS